MGTIRDWVRRHRALAAFAAGVLLTLAAVAVVALVILADQRRSARVLEAALSQALHRGVEIDRVTDLGPSRVVLRGLRLPADRGWPVEMKAESVEASGPLLSAARGDSAPVRLLVTSYTSPCENVRPYFLDGAFERVSQKRNPSWSRVCARVLEGGLVQIGDPVAIATANVAR